MTRRTYKTSRAHRTWSMLKRDRLRDLKLCITSAEHGPATHGVLCKACREVHRRSA